MRQLLIILALLLFLPSCDLAEANTTRSRFVLTSRTLFPWAGNTFSPSGSFTYSSTGAVQINTTAVIAQSPSLPIGIRIVSARFLVRDNGIDSWACTLAVVTAQDVPVTNQPRTSTGSGTWEWIDVHLGFTLDLGTRLVATCSASNSGAGAMLSSGVELVYLI